MFPVIRNAPGGKGGRCVRLTTYYHYSAVVTKTRSLNSPGPVRAYMACWGPLYLLPLLFIISPLLCLSTILLLAFPFSSLFSFCRPLFHFYLLYFFIALPSHLHSLIRSIFCVFPFVLFFHVFPLCISFLFLFFSGLVPYLA